MNLKSILSAAAMTAALALAACGGGDGGGGSAETPTTPTTPTTYTAASAAACWDGSHLTATSQVSQAAAQAAADALVPGSCKAQPVTTCTAPAQQNALGACMSPPVTGAFAKDDATGNIRSAVASDFTWSVAAKVWMANMGVKITNPQDIGATKYVANDVGLADGGLWEKYSADGTIKFAMSDIVIPGYNGRKVMFAYYKTNQSPGGVTIYQRFPIWADTNNAATINPPVDNGGFQEPSDYSYGSQAGFVVHSASGCWESYWAPVVNNFSSRSVICRY